MTAEHADFVYRVMNLLYEREDADSVWWSCEDGRISFLVNCNDFFAWGCADCEEITPDNIAVLEQAYKDCEAAGDRYERWGASLFCARVRGMRPQGACYPKDAPAISALFDACGEKRPVDFANPHKHPEDGGGYAYTESCDAK